MDAGYLIGTALVAVVGPLLLSTLNNRNQMKREERQNKRLDAVAKNALDAANISKKNLTANEVVANQTKTLGGRIEQVHTLVNADKTAGKRRELILLKEIVGLRITAGQKISSEAQETISKLEQELSERERQTEIAEEQLEQLGRRPDV